MEPADLVGVVPAAGRATRLGLLPCSKEILPIHVADERSGERVVVLCESLLDSMRAGGATRALLAIGDGKWDIPAYLGSGSPELPLAYVVVRESPNAAVTTAAALPFAPGAHFLFGFPDIVFKPANAFLRLRRRQAESGAAVVLGLFPMTQPERVDVVEVDPSGRVLQIVAKPGPTHLRHAWIIAVWSPAFSSFLADCASTTVSADTEVYIGEVIQRSVAAGMFVDSVTFADGAFRDLGVLADLRATLREGQPEGARPTPT